MISNEIFKRDRSFFKKLKIKKKKNKSKKSKKNQGKTRFFY